MERYCINIDIEGYNSTKIELAEEIQEGSVVVVFLDSSTSKGLSVYYSGIYTLIRKN